ncbi:MAG: glutaminase domain-containing protein [Terriglobales bacterium]
MHSWSRRWALAAIPFLTVSVLSQVAPLRAPAVPLAIHDPSFSLWAMGDNLTSGPTRHWSGTPMPLTGLVRVDGVTYRFLGGDRAYPALPTTALTVTPTRTVAVEANAAVELTITFLNPLLPQDLDLLSRPVTYLSWSCRSRDGQPHDVSLYLDATGALATNDATQFVDWSRGQAGADADASSLDLLRIGTRDQAALQRFGDNVRQDWGWFYLALPRRLPHEWAAANPQDRAAFARTGHLAGGDDLDAPRQPASHYPPPPTLNLVLPLGSVGSAAVERHILLAFDERPPIEYMHQQLRPYWMLQHPTFAALLEAAESGYAAVTARAAAFDRSLTDRLTRAGGPEYAAIATLAFGQAIAAHKLVVDSDGTPFFMPKENFSNGSISTVDVIYPSAPEFLLLNPKLVEAQLEPVLRYAAGPRWKFPFAPHDLGVYPLANGQQYGGGETSEENQMPVEETGNVLLLMDAIAHQENSAAFAARWWPQLTQWADYLMAKGLDPENQLCTDDFAGHLAHNANLSLKAIEAIAAYGQLAARLGHPDLAEKYQSAAHRMAAQWVTMAQDGASANAHFKLAFDRPGTWSQKYNLVWDKILGLDLFPPQVAASAVAWYRGHLNPYGLPLDNRATYTKLDWTIWTATLAANQADFQALIHPVFEFLRHTPNRVPMTDWYDTVSGKQVGFQARSVVGGVFIKLLAEH